MVHFFFSPLIEKTVPLGDFTIFSATLIQPRAFIANRNEMVTKLNTNQFLEQLTNHHSKYCIAFNSLPATTTAISPTTCNEALTVIADFHRFHTQYSHDPLLPPVVDNNRLRQVLNLIVQIQTLQDKILAKLELYPNTLVLHLPPS
jgi:hypothetical protein